MGFWRMKDVSLSSQTQRQRGYRQSKTRKPWRGNRWSHEKILKHRSKISERILNAEQHLFQTKRTRPTSFCNRERVKGELGWWWMPEKASRYPPIHDQIDTPTDFGVAVRKRQQRRNGSTSQRGDAERMKQWNHCDTWMTQSCRTDVFVTGKRRSNAKEGSVQWSRMTQRNFWDWGFVLNHSNISPVNGALLFSYYSLEISELEEMIMEVVQVENADQQEGGGNENPGEQLGHRELLQAQVLQAGAKDGRICRKRRKEVIFSNKKFKSEQTLKL